MEIERKEYLQALIDSKSNGLVKVITGIRRCGKSYLLDPIFTDYLRSVGVENSHIVKIDLDERENRKYWNPDALDSYVRGLIKDRQTYYILLDEVQFVKDFESVLNGFLHIRNLDVYVTGSNSRFLSSDIITEFRGRGTQIKVYPLSFKEYYSATKIEKRDAFSSYMIYGGMPFLTTMGSDGAKAKYLKELFDLTYTKDIVERNGLRKDDILECLINILASSIGSLTNATRIFNTFVSDGYKGLSKETIIKYLSHLTDSFLVEKVDRYDIKGKRYISSSSKYYYEDVGLRNARLNFRQVEENHIMENIIYLELVRRGFNVDVGVVEINEDHRRKQLEVDFVCNEGSKRYYIQSALNLDTRGKTVQEEKPLMNVPDSFKKIIIVKDSIPPWHNEEGILVLGIIDFLLDGSCLEV